MISPSRSNGFTLIELMITIAIAGVLAAVALPQMQSFIAQMRVKNLAMDLHADLAFARSEAIKRNTTVVLGAAGDWNSGWTVTAGGTVIRQHEVVAGSVTLSGSASVTFNTSGRAQSQFSLEVTSPSLSSSNNSRCVKLELSGRPQITKGTCT